MLIPISSPAGWSSSGSSTASRRTLRTIGMSSSLSSSITTLASCAGVAGFVDANGLFVDEGTFFVDADPFPLSEYTTCVPLSMLSGITPP